MIARNSAFQYRNKSHDIKKVGRELGARYIVEGSVRRLGPQIRVTAQLIDATTGSHLWAERYDRRIEELFDVQDEVVRAVVTSSEHRIADVEAEQVARRPPNSWLAYDFYLQARHYLARYENYGKAEAPLLRAIELDPMAEAHAKLAHVEIVKYCRDLDISHIDKAYRYARQSLSSNPNHSDAHTGISIVYAFQDRMDLALLHADRALALNPNNVLAAVDRAQWLVFSGKYGEALAELEMILKRDPFPPSWYWDTKGAALFQLERYQETIDAYSMVSEPQSWEIAYMAASMAYLGRIEDARYQINLLLTTHPTMTISKMLKIERYQTEQGRNNFTEGLRKAGLPD